jgi:Carbohydrate family 9 binding domain-like
MKKLYQSSIFSFAGFAICYLSLFIIASVTYAQELHVNGICRISHPAYDMENLSQTRSPGTIFNVDFSRVMMAEVGGETPVHPLFPRQRTLGKGIIWGCIADSCVTQTAGGLGDSISSKLQDLNLDNLSNLSEAARAQSLIDWDTNTIQMPSKYTGHIYWSPYPGETNIVYTLDKPNKYLVTYNVDTGVETRIVYLSSVTNDSQVIGFSKSVLNGPKQHVILVDIDYNSIGGGSTYEIFTDHNNHFANPVVTTRQEPQSCDAEQSWWPNHMAPHDSQSPDGAYFVNYGTFNGVAKNDYSGRTCVPYQEPPASGVKYWIDDTVSTYWIAHVDWHGNNDWFMGSDVTADWPAPSHPHIRNERVFQVFFNRAVANTNIDNPYASGVFSHHVVIDRPSAGYWTNGCDQCAVNYHAIPSATISSATDANGHYWLHFHGTNGKFTRDDYKLRSDITGSNWEGRGSYIADLTTSTSSQTCTSFIYSPWGPCQPNNSQTRTVISAQPEGCMVGDPISTQMCTYTKYTILKTAVSPIIDGKLDEYALANSVSFSPSAGGNTVTVKALWDSEALYLGYEVTDTQLNASVTTRDGSVWNDDSVELFIDTLANGGGSSNPNSPYMLPDDYHVIINILNTQYDSQGTTSGAPSSSWNSMLKSAVKFNSTINDNTDTDSGYTIEIKIPWTALGYAAAPSDDTIMGMSFAVNDLDASGRVWLMWPDNSTIVFENASAWQNVLLSGQTVSDKTATPNPPPKLMAIN